MQQLSLILAKHLDVSDQQDSWDTLDVLLNRLLPRKLLGNYGMLETDIDLFASSVVRHQQRLLVNNYEELDRS